MINNDRPSTAPDFLLSRASGSIRTQGTSASFPDPFEAATALHEGQVDLVVGAVPFDTGNRAALSVPESVLESEGPLEPPAHYRGMEAAGQLEVLGVFPLSSPEEHQMTVSAAIGTMQNTRLRKVVLARAVDVAFADEIDPLLIAARMIDLSALRDGYAVDLSATGRADDRGTMLVGSSPRCWSDAPEMSSRPTRWRGRRHDCPTRRRTRPSDAPSRTPPRTSPNTSWLSTTTARC